eukprot:15366570-Ditylum_brightwellii.AAC.1
MKGCDKNDSNKIILFNQKASKQFLTYMYLKNSDQQKYSWIPINLNCKKSLVNDQYSNTLSKQVMY